VIGRRRVAAVVAVLLVALLAPPTRAADERPNGYVLDWDSGTGKSYVIPAVEVPGVVLVLNAFNRLVVDPETYSTDGHSIWKNLRTAPRFDTDPFNINQIGHPYLGSMYYGFARSAGLSYWESLGYTLFGSFLWETGGEKSPPSVKPSINRGNVGLTVRAYGPHALSLNYVVSNRDARIAGVGDRHQAVETVTLSYNFLGHTRFGATEWRAGEMPTR